MFFHPLSLRLHPTPTCTLHIGTLMSVINPSHIEFRRKQPESVDQVLVSESRKDSCLRRKKKKKRCERGSQCVMQLKQQKQMRRGAAESTSTWMESTMWIHVGGRQQHWV